MHLDKERRRSLAQAWAIALVLLAGSARAQDLPSAQAITAAAAKADSTTPAPAPAAPSSSSAEPAPVDNGNGPGSEFIRGHGGMIGASPVPHASGSDVTEDGGITLNFVNADVREVAKAVLGDFLGLNYAIGSTVQGTVTVQTSRPLGRTQVLPVLEQALRLNGLALVKNSGIYKIIPIADAPREGFGSISTRGGSPEAGYGVEIVPLKYVGAAQMQTLLEPIGPAQAVVHADPSRNVLIIEGTQSEREAIVNQIELFDVDWLSGMSFALFTPQYTDARGLAGELNQILGGSSSPMAGIVRLVPIERLNSVLVISSQQRYLEQIQRWVERLDKPGVGSDRRVYVYAVQNGRASELASVLKKVLYGTSNTKDDAPDSGSTSESADAAPPAATSAAGSAASTVATGGPPPPPSASSSSHHNGGLIDNSNDTSSAPQGSATITADETNNAIVVYGTPQQYATIDAALRQLDKPPLQVLLEAAIAEVTLTDNLQYGVQYFYQPSNEHQLVLSNSGSADITSAFPGFSYIFSQGSNIRVVLNTLASVTHVDVISSPEVLVLNNRTATLQVGDQVPIETSEAVSVTTADAPIVNTIQYEPTGVILKVTPRVNQSGMVIMDVSQDVSDVSSTTTSSLNSPTISEKKVESTIAVQDNQTIALGGLITDSKTRSSSGLPFLSEIPVIGALFGTKTNNGARTELMVLITPHVIDNLQSARAITEELRHRLPAVENLLQKTR